MKRLGMFIFTGFILGLSFAQSNGDVNYASQGFKSGFTINHPKPWHARERKDNTTGITSLIFTQANSTGALQGYVSISAIDGGAASSLDGFVSDILTRRGKMKNMKVISDANSSIGKIKARDIILSYSGRDRLEASTRDIIIRQRLVIFEKNNNYFTFKYESPQESYADNSEVFDKMLKSLKFN